jgi:hypothetical protein
MGKYKKPKRQTDNKPANIVSNEKPSAVIYVDGRFHTNLAIKRIVEETIQNYKEKLSENKWIQSQKQKQQLVDYNFYRGLHSNILEETVIIDKEISLKDIQVQDSFFKKLFNRIKNAINM